MKYPSIEKYIAEHNLSLREFARQCDMPSSTICQLLKGDTEPSKSTIDKILAVIGLSYEVCFREETCHLEKKAILI
ncbi:helix-turn-helix domain-containing protein [Blautia hydrogenotrophica]|jgi:predicted transcriptional regulator|uniref:helix-turn-helix domain-containing protein n=1 Tax=Blautia hydrogenotrophica TaxID=53443 RepID=UPI003AB2666B